MKKLNMAQPFNWLAFLKAHRIDFVERGPNVAREHLGIKCPFCGPSDPSHHMGVSLNTKEPYWGCWRDAEHRGKSPIRIIQKLLNCSVGDAIKEAEKYRGQVNPDDKRELKPATHLELPAYFKPLRGDANFSSIFWNYMVTERGYSPMILDSLCNYYRLHYCTIGDWNMRIIIPVYLNGKLVTWTGRTIRKKEDEPVRYKSLSLAHGAIRAVENIKHTVLDADNLSMGGKVLLINEGPFDPMLINYLGMPHGVHATCLFSNTISTEQMLTLVPIMSKYERVIVMLDEGAKAQALAIAGQLAAFHPNVQQRDLLGFKDTGELGLKDAQNLINLLLGK